MAGALAAGVFTFLLAAGAIYDIAVGKSGVWSAIGIDSGALRWLGLKNRRSNMLVELRLTGNTGRNKLVQVSARFRTENDALAKEPAWQRACIRRFVDLRGYLIAPSEGE